MAAAAQRPKLVVIVGPTASGKSELAMRVAEEFNGEIITADSRTIYKGMDIGTAKPTKQDRAKAKHWGLDLLEPGQRFTAYQFKRYAVNTISDIQGRGKLPILVGGTGLYVNCVIFNYQFEPDAERDPLNPRHRLKKQQEDSQLIPGSLIVGLTADRPILENRIKERVQAMINEGLIDEVKSLTKKYPIELEAFKAPGYQPFLQYIGSQVNLSEATSSFIQGDLKLAKKQKTWFKRNKFIHWFEGPETAFEYIKTQLNT